MTSLREFHRASGNNLQQIKVGDEVLIHDEGPRINWKLAIVEEPIKGNDGLVRATHIRTSNCTTARPIVQLYLLEVVSNNQSTMDCSEQHPADDHPVRTTTTDVDCTIELDSTSHQPVVLTRRVAATKALRKVKEWNDMIRSHPEDV